MPASVVYEAINPAVLLHCGVDQVLDLEGFGNVTKNERGFAGSCSVQFIRDRLTFLCFARAEDDHRSGVNKSLYTTFADAFASASNDYYFVCVHSCYNPGTSEIRFAYSS